MARTLIPLILPSGAPPPAVVQEHPSLPVLVASPVAALLGPVDPPVGFGTPPPPAPGVVAGTPLSS
jgi:hypothetical protein